jgi:hypothetical protein
MKNTAAHQEWFTNRSFRKDGEKIMGLFKKPKPLSYDRENQKPVIKASICNGEQVAGFKDIHTGEFEEVMLIKNAVDLEQFKMLYEITGEIEKEY